MIRHLMMQQACRTLCVAVLFFTGLSTYGQTQSVRQPVTVYCLDGSVLKGEVVSWSADSLLFQMPSGTQLRLGKNNIQNVVMNDTNNHFARSAQRRNREYAFKGRGLYNLTTLAFSAGPLVGTGFTHVTGYRFSRMLSLGGGTGIESYDLGSGEQMVPLFAEIRGFLTERNVSPYYALRAGYGFGLSTSETNLTKAKGGPLMVAEFGYRFGGKGAVNFFAGAGVHFQRAEYRYNVPWEIWTTNRIWYRRTELRLGVMF